MPPRRITPALLFTLVVGFLLLRAALFAVTTASEYSLYRDYATTAAGVSTAELHRTRDIEYPPLAVSFAVVVLRLAELLPDEAARLVDWRPLSTHDTAGARYEVALGLVLFAVDLACLALVYLIARRVYPDDSPLARVGRVGLYVAATTALGLIFFDRQDAVIALVAVAALAAFVWDWPVLAYSVLAAGAGYKLVPVLLLPLWVFAFAAARSAPCSTGRFLRTVVCQALIAGAVLAVVPVLMFLFCGGERAFVFLTFHSVRGLQIEAPAAVPVFLFDHESVVGHSFGSHTFRGAWPDKIAAVMSVAMAAVTMLTVFIAARGFRRAAVATGPRNRNELTTHLAGSSLLVWLGFILFNKVGSPQYLLWLAPLVPLLPLRGADRWWAGLLLVEMVLVTLCYPCRYPDVRGEPTDEPLTWSGPNALGLSLLTAKALVLAMAFVWLTLLVWRARWFSTFPDRAAPNPEVV